MTPLSVIPENIPAELREGIHHVGWKLEERGGKLTKPPYAVRTGGFAAVNDPSTWCHFQEALDAHRMGLYSGVGYVLTTDDDLVGFDLDGVRDPISGTVTVAAGKLVKWLGSYTEISPSGTGLRILVRGILPVGARRRGKVEVYSADRYLTLTGHRLEGLPATIERRELAAIHARLFPVVEAPVAAPNVVPLPLKVSPDDVVLLERARAAKNGARFAALYDRGDVGDDHSAADLALMNHLLFWTGQDTARAEALFRRSALYRPKWDERHHADGRTYGAGTVGYAVGGRRCE